MKTFYSLLNKYTYILILLTISFNGIAQSGKVNYTIGLANLAQTINTIEMDVTFSINSPTKGTKLSQISVGINFNTSILSNGNPCSAKNCGSWIYIGGKSPAISNLLTTVTTTNYPYGHLRIIGRSLNEASSIEIQNGTYTLGRYRFVNTEPWSKNSNAKLWLQPTNDENATNTIVSVYPVNSQRKLVAYTTTNTEALTLEYTSEAPLNYILNSKETQLSNFEAIAIPNPFSDSFKFEFKTTSEKNIEIKVYNILGQLIEQNNSDVSAIENVQLGSNYQSGIYTITVTQGNNSDTLRIIKR